MIKIIQFYTAFIICSLFRKLSKHFGLWRLRKYIWNLAERELNQNFVANIRISSGEVLSVNLQDFDGRYLFVHGSCEHGILNYLNSLKIEDASVIDIGANLGFLTIAFANSIAKKGVVYSFEPAKNTFVLLKNNIKRNNKKNIQIFNEAVSDKSGDISFFYSRSHSGSSAIWNRKSTEESYLVKSSILDNYLDKFGKIDLVKIDVEGAELQVINGMNNIINKFKPIILIELIDSLLIEMNSSSQQIISLLQTLGYELKKIEFDTLANLDNSVNRCGNYLAIPKIQPF